MTFSKWHKHSQETRNRIGVANRWVWIKFKCDNCWIDCEEKQSHYIKKKRHFCNMRCYSEFRKTKLPKEEHNAYWKWMHELECIKRRMCRRKLNYALEKWDIKRLPCEKCWDKNSEWHHSDYSKPLDIMRLCFKCHRKLHYENTNLITNMNND